MELVMGSKRRNTEEREEEEKQDRYVLYGVEENPTFLLWPVFGLQQAVMCITGTLSIPFLITREICASDLFDVRARLLSTAFFMCGVGTILQDTIGVRLPIIQGGSHTFIPPIVAMMKLEKWSCPEPGKMGVNSTDDEPWKVRMREIQGGLILASLTQVVLGMTGLVGFLLRFIGPLTIAPTISLIGLSLTGVVVRFSKPHWGIAFLSVSLILLFSLILDRIKLPFPGYTRKKHCHVVRYPIFQLAPVLFAIGLSWLFCHILTVTDVFPSNSTESAYRARTDSSISAVDNAPWFFFPYPFQFGTPTISAAGYVGILAATISSVIESIGDYFAAARVSGAPPPPAHAMNRGIAMEGFTSVISGIVGAGHATTSYSGNIGAIAITKVASRRVFQAAGFILIICGVIGKFGAVLTIIPEPIIGGLNAVLLGLVAAVGISTLQFVDLASSRNLTILGISLMLGLAVPQWAAENPKGINTGNAELDQVLGVLLGTAMFVGGTVGCLLDNIVPGTPEERGLVGWRDSLTSSDSQTRKSTNDIYEFPYLTKHLRKIKCCSYMPFMPTFDKDFHCSRTKHQPSNSKRYTFEQTVDMEENHL